MCKTFPEITFIGSFVKQAWKSNTKTETFASLRAGVQVKKLS